MRQLWPFDVVDGGQNRAQFKFEWDGNDKLMYAEEVSAKVLERMRLFAENFSRK